MDNFKAVGSSLQGYNCILKLKYHFRKFQKVAKKLKKRKIHAFLGQKLVYMKRILGQSEIKKF